MTRSPEPLPIGTCVTSRGSFACSERGEGEPLIFIHGSLGSLHDFSRQMTLFGESYRKLAYSRRYHPPNPGPAPGELYTIEGHAADLEGMIRGLDAGPVHLVGSSWGAYTALALVLRRPELASSLVLAEPPILPLLGRSPAGRILFDRFHGAAILPSRAAFGRGETEEGVRRFVDGIAGKEGSFDALPPKARTRLVEAGPELRAEFETPFNSYMPLPDVADLALMRTPVLLLQGDRSPKMFHLIQDELELAIPDAERITIPRSGHSVHIENAHAFNEIVGDFLRRHRWS
jgi:pimeloyl-ACP methyl ester carboxylesterase